MKKRVTIIIALVALLGVTLSLSSAAAYNNYDNPAKNWYYTSGDLDLYYDWGDNLQEPTSDWKTAFNWAKTDWDNAGTAVDWSPSGSGTNIFNTYDDEDGRYGKCEWQFGETYLIGNKVYGNLANDPETSIGRREIAGHELGHAIGLGHSTVDPALMEERELDSDESYPLTDDVAGVDALY